jgi:hypothetical protein
MRARGRGGQAEECVKRRVGGRKGGGRGRVYREKYCSLVTVASSFPLRFMHVY